MKSYELKISTKIIKITQNSTLRITCWQFHYFLVFVNRYVFFISLKSSLFNNYLTYHYVDRQKRIYHTSNCRTFMWFPIFVITIRTSMNQRHYWNRKEDGESFLQKTIFFSIISSFFSGIFFFILPHAV